MDQRKINIFRLQLALILLFIGMLSLGVTIVSVIASTSSTSAVTADTTDNGAIGLGAGLAIGLAGLGAGIGLGTASSAAIGAISERPEMFGRTIIFVAFIEGIGVFGFVIAFLLYLLL